VKVHLMGIGGAGVSSLASVYLGRGDQVSGCDVRASATTDALAERGAIISVGHDPAHVAGQDLVVYSAAVAPGNPELLSALRSGVATSRAQALAQLIAATDSIAVAGTHGKTTVTYMVGHVLTRAGRDPTVLVGDGTSSRVGHGDLLVAETDESDGSLVLHRPRNAIVTNIELDHPDHFTGVEAVERDFGTFLGGVSGVAVVCADDARAAGLPTLARRVTFGFAAGARYRCTDETPARLFCDGAELGRLELQVPGRHNVQNACAAVAMCLELGVDFATAAAALATFPGARRRMERLGSWRGATLYDDYGHHPTEVRATLAAARRLPHKRLVLVFQPHRYSRWAAFRDEFTRSFAGADELILTEVYAAGEPDPGGITAAGVPGARFARDLAEARTALEEVVREGDLVLLMGAGDIRRLGDELAK
jgi:UDP-N-acetylmuramate--alanine ligase